MDFINILTEIAGTNKNIFDFLYMGCRAFIIYFIMLIIFRLHIRLVKKYAPFDFIINFVIGSLVAQAIVNKEQFALNIIAIFIILGFNYTLSAISYYSKFANNFFKGKSKLLVKNGEIQWNTMRNFYITKKELRNAIHKANIKDINKVKAIYMENTGEISVIN